MPCDWLGTVGFVFLVIAGTCAAVLIIRWVYRVTSAVEWLWSTCRKYRIDWTEWQHPYKVDTELLKRRIDTFESTLSRLEADRGTKSKPKG